MHNKRIGRDDLLKIEVSIPKQSKLSFKEASTDVMIAAVGPHTTLCFLAL